MNQATSPAAAPAAATSISHEGSSSPRGVNVEASERVAVTMSLKPSTFSMPAAAATPSHPPPPITVTTTIRRVVSLLPDTTERRDQLKNLATLLIQLFRNRKESVSSGRGGGQAEVEGGEAHISQTECFRALRGLSDREMDDLYTMAQGAQEEEEGESVLLDQLLVLISTFLD
jgi:hypothetical protein